MKISILKRTLKTKIIKFYTKKHLYIIGILYLSLVFMCSCTSKTDVTNTSETSSVTKTKAIMSDTTTPLENTEIQDLLIDFDDNTYVDIAPDYITESDEDVTLKSGSNYTLKGTLTNKRIRIERGASPDTKLTLKNFNATSNKDSIILADDDCNVHIELADDSINEMTLTNVDKTKNQDAYNNTVIFSRDSLTFGGAGTLTINSNTESSIDVEDNITFLSGNYVFNSNGDAIRAKNVITFSNGNFNIKSGDDAVKSRSEKNGNINVENAIISINAGDKGFNSDNKILITGGEINIDSFDECISGKNVDILGGKLNLITQDDAINSNDNNQNKKNNQIDVYTRIANCELNINSGMDGIDSNGDLYLDSGKIFINGSENNNERIIDYNGKITYGEDLLFIGLGPSSKMQGLGDNPNQNYIIAYYKNAQNSNQDVDNIEIQDENDNILLETSTSKSYFAIMLASPKLIAGKKYKITNNENEMEVILEKGKNEIYE